MKWGTAQQHSTSGGNGQGGSVSAPGTLGKVSPYFFPLLPPQSRYDGDTFFPGSLWGFYLFVPILDTTTCFQRTVSCIAHGPRATFVSGRKQESLFANLVMHGVFASSRMFCILVTRNTFLMLCCMQTMLQKATIQQVLSLTVRFVSHTNLHRLYSRSLLKFCALEWVHSSSTWLVAVLDKVSLPKVPPTPSLSSCHVSPNITHEPNTHTLTSTISFRVSPHIRKGGGEDTGNYRLQVSAHAWPVRRLMFSCGGPSCCSAYAQASCRAPRLRCPIMSSTPHPSPCTRRGMRRPI